MATPASLGVSTAQLWDTSRTEGAFKDIVEQQRLDDERKRKEAEAQRKAQLEESKAMKKYLDEELYGHEFDTSKIFEVRDGDAIRTEINKRMDSLLAEPGFGERFYKGDKDAVAKVRNMKLEIAGMINKSAAHKQDAKTGATKELADEYYNTVVVNEMPWVNPNYREAEAKRAYDSLHEPMADVMSPVKKADAYGDWMTRLDDERDLFVNQVSSQYGSRTRKKEENERIVQEFWSKPEYAQEMYEELGIDWRKSMNPEELTAEENEKIKSFYADKVNEAMLKIKKGPRPSVKDSGATKEDMAIISDWLAPLNAEDIGERKIHGIDLKQTQMWHVGEDASRNKIYEERPRFGDYASYKALALDKTGAGMHNLEGIIESNSGIDRVVFAESPEGRRGFLIFEGGEDMYVSDFVGVDEVDVISNLVVGSPTYRNKKKYGSVTQQNNVPSGGAPGDEVFKQQ